MGGAVVLRVLHQNLVRHEIVRHVRGEVADHDDGDIGLEELRWAPGVRDRNGVGALGDIEIGSHGGGVNRSCNDIPFEVEGRACPMWSGGRRLD